MTYQNALKIVIAAAVFFAADQVKGQTTAATKIESENSRYTPWERIAESDITYKKRLWKDINLNDEPNKSLLLADTRNPLIKILVDCVIKGKIKAYGTENDRFTHEMTRDEFMDELKSKYVAGDPITTYAIKEDFLVVKSGEKTTRILGLAPMIATTQPDGTVKKAPLFWVYYPDCRSILADQLVDENVTWDDLFEHRSFTGVVTKVGEPRTRPNEGNKSKQY